MTDQTPSDDSFTRTTPATLALGSCCERVEYSLTNVSFASFNAPYNPVRLMYEKN